MKGAEQARVVGSFCAKGVLTQRTQHTYARMPAARKHAKAAPHRAVAPHA